MSSQHLYAVTYGGEFYEGIPPESANASWMTSASRIGTTGWADFRHLFFHPDGTLFGVVNDKFYKAPPPKRSSSEEWIAQATLIGDGGWESFKFLFFDPEGVLYGVHDDRLYKRYPPSNDQDHWLGSATLVGAAGWSDFNFLFFDSKGILYGVENGKFHKRKPPVDRNDSWLGSSTFIGDEPRWHGCRHLLFMASGELYAVSGGTLFKELLHSGRRGYSSTMIGHSGWDMFKYLMSPLGHK